MPDRNVHDIFFVLAEVKRDLAMAYVHCPRASGLRQVNVATPKITLLRHRLVQGIVIELIITINLIIDGPTESGNNQ